MGDNRWRFPTDDTQDIVRFLVIWAPKEVIIRISKDRGQGLVWRPAHVHKRYDSFINKSLESTPI